MIPRRPNRVKWNTKHPAYRMLSSSGGYGPQMYLSTNFSGGTTYFPLFDGLSFTMSGTNYGWGTMATAPYIRFPKFYHLNQNAIDLGIYPIAYTSGDDEFLVSAWCMRNWELSNYDCVIHSSYAPTAGMGFLTTGNTYQDWTGGDIVFCGNGFNSGRAPRAIADCPVWPNWEWHHLMGVLGPTNANIYIDGVEVSSYRVQSTGAITASYIGDIGNNGYGDGWYGSLVDVTVAYPNKNADFDYVAKTLSSKDPMMDGLLEPAAGIPINNILLNASKAGDAPPVVSTTNIFMGVSL